MGMMKKFIKYILQSVAGMLGISAYILVDTYFISINSGAAGLAALNLILPIFGLIYAIGAMIGMGFATKFGIAKAAGEETRGVFMQSIVASLIACVPFVAIGIIAPDAVIRLLGADDALAHLGKNYVRIILIVTPLFMCNFTFTAFARNDNGTKVAMAGALVGSLVNIVFDYIFIFVFGMGFTGAALATACCPIATMLVCVKHFRSDKNTINFNMKCASAIQVLKALSLGVSAFVGEISSAVTTLVFNYMIIRLAGNTGVAAYGVVANVSLVVVAIFNGIAQGAQPIFSEKYGLGDNVGVKQNLRYGIITCLIVELLTVVGIWCATDSLIAIFNSEGNQFLLEYAHIGMRLYFLGFVFAGVNTLLVAYFAATERVRGAIICSILRGMVAIAICAVVMGNLFGMNGVWLSLLASEFITFIVILTQK